MNTSQQRGMTLIELVVAIVVIAIAITSVLAVLSLQASRSADAMVTAQAAKIAETYLSEVLEKQYAGAGAPSRATFNNINNYNGMVDGGVRDQTGAAVANLDQFTVTVAVVPGVLGAVVAGQVRLINITVKHTNGTTVLLSGYRTFY
jgi:MSHA pilin protein MshD